MIYDDLEAASTVVLVEGNLPKKYAAFLHFSNQRTCRMTGLLCWIMGVQTKELIIVAHHRKINTFGEQAFLDKLAQVL